jgi:hypothetical protein
VGRIGIDVIEGRRETDLLLNGLVNFSLDEELK